MDLAIHTHELRREFGTFVAVDGIDGAGKSTTIKCLTGLLAPTSGSVSLLGLDRLKDPVAVKRQVGVVPQDLAMVAQGR